MRAGAIILCGGKSSRMGQDKALLPFGAEPLLQRVVRVVNEVVAIENLVVVAGIDQQLPSLPEGLTVVRDTDSFRGPLNGLATGIEALGSSVDAIFATGCDYPLLTREFVLRMFSLLGSQDACVPSVSGRLHPLAAVYRPAVLAHVRQLLTVDRLQMQGVFAGIATREISAEDLHDIDPQLRFLTNVNTEEEYHAVLRALDE